MNIHHNIDELLAADNRDAGCSASFEVLHLYVDAEVAGGDPARSLPGLAAHLHTCPACRADYLGMLTAAERFGDAGPPTP